MMNNINIQYQWYPPNKHNALYELFRVTHYSELERVGSFGSETALLDFLSEQIKFDFASQTEAQS